MEDTVNSEYKVMNNKVVENRISNLHMGFLFAGIFGAYIAQNQAIHQLECKPNLYLIPVSLGNG